ncbi:MAG: hypothetical protein IT557_06125 [Alphaproteobacteria bacterium]|nr:hypothetical protein [Alphaproteobacteria bacterium]
MHAGLLDAQYNFLASMGRGLVDVLRLGESIRKPSVGAVFRDGMRILTILPVGRIVKVGAQALGIRAAVGGPMTCVITSDTVAARIAGTRLFITLEELWSAANGGKVFSKITSLMVQAFRATFPGLANWRAMVPALKGFGVTVEEVGAQNMAHVADAAQLGRGPVVFAVRWVGRVGTQLEQMGGHVMCAFRTMKGEIMIADQMGVRPLAQFLQEVGPFTVQGGYIVRYARWISDTELLLRGAQFGRQFGRVPELKQATGLFIPGISQWGAEAEQEWLAKHLDLGFYHLAGPIAARIDAEARRALGRPQRRPHKPGPFTPPTSTLPPLWDDPNLEGASRNVRQLWEAFRGLSGGTGQAVTVE